MGIIEDLYRTCVFGQWLGENASEITKADIFAIKTEDPIRDMYNVKGMCEINVICRMYQEMQEVMEG